MLCSARPDWRDCGKATASVQRRARHKGWRSCCFLSGEEYRLGYTDSVCPIPVTDWCYRLGMTQKRRRD